MTKKKLSAMAFGRFQGDLVADSFLQEKKIIWHQSNIEERFVSNFENLQIIIQDLRAFKTNKDIIALNKKTKKSSAESFVYKSSSTLPAWADPKKIKRAEKIFAQDGALICVLLFVASLPEVYRFQDISVMLNATGNLEKVTEQRIRTTALMTLSVLLPGGLTAASATGRVQVLRARLMHAVLRNFLLRSSVLKGQSITLEDVPPYKGKSLKKNMFEKAAYHGWKTSSLGVPCNQIELGYTLLTFSYVYLRSLRRLGISISSKDEVAYLHFWNIVGHFMGVDRNLMAEDMDQAEQLFKKFLELSSEKRNAADPRTKLGRALVKTIEKSVDIKPLKPLVMHMMEYLTSSETVSVLGLKGQFSDAKSLQFQKAIEGIKKIDRGVQKIMPGASFMRMFVRVMGFQLLKKVLSDPENPIDLPKAQRRKLEKLIDIWSDDIQSPDWLNFIEDLFTVRNSWNKKLKF